MTVQIRPVMPRYSSYLHCYLYTSTKPCTFIVDLKSVSYSSSDLKGLADSENPLDPVNRIHCLLKMFLNAHSGFCRDEIQDYLNLYSFVINSPSDHLEKVEKIINLVFENPKSLKYRDQFAVKP